MTERSNNSKSIGWLKRVIPVLLILITMQNIGFATHIRAGEITVERKNCSGNIYIITILGYRDTGSIIEFGGGVLDFGDGTDPVPIPEGWNQTDVGNLISRNVYTIEHEYAANGIYTISYLEQNRNEGILNISNSVLTPFYVESQIVIDGFLGCNNSPKLLVPPIDEGCTGVAFYHNAGAYDIDGDSLSYEFTIPMQAKDAPVGNYRDPNLEEFYVGRNYSQSNEAGTNTPSFTINPITGDVIWDAPGAAGEYNIAFRIIEWRKVGGQWWQMGFVTRDMQIIVQDCDNERPKLELPPDLCVEAGTLIDETIFGEDPDGDDVKIEAFSGVFEFLANPAQIVPDPGINDYVLQPTTTQFLWQTTCDHIREEPYQVVFKITDNPDNGPQLVTFETWNITVIGPAPELTSVVRNNRTAELDWESYVCRNRAESIEVWRRVDSFDYTPDECETGIREEAGYELIDTVDGSATNYIDTNNGKQLAWGARYCYRLVAIFPEPLGGESIVSQEICIDPVEANAPVITHVTVDETDVTNGQITVRWLPPFDLDPNTFTPPLEYEITRFQGLAGGTGGTSIGRTSSIEIMDTGLNTLDFPYHYIVTAFDAEGTEIETSVAASSVRLTPTPEFRQITLRWEADVPWSNNIQGYTHEIYRSQLGNGDALELLDYVNVNQTGFVYVDSGQANNVPLEDTEVYCYYVKTFGSYGNPDIAVPQINLSQIVCAQPNDTIPPCVPVLFINELECRDLGDMNSNDDGSYFFDNVNCDFDGYNNELRWAMEEECSKDIKYYELEFQRSAGASFDLIATISDTSFVHGNLPSFKGCYRVRAVDRSGNVSEYSNVVCKDNCPRYVLPNLFTPDGSGQNDKFYAFSYLTKSDLLKKDCPRFVERVVFKVYNRWGGKVYEYDSHDESNGETTTAEEAILIGWDGKTNAGEDLAAGIYYYTAEVEFDLFDESDNVRVIKGWVQLLR